MKITRKIENNELILTINGRLDTITASIFENELKNIYETTNLVIDMKNLEYISSAGLRVILKIQKIINKNGTMKLKNVNENVMEVLNLTGFSDFLAIE